MGTALTLSDRLSSTDPCRRSQPQRVPSYCDRVLHKSLPGRRANLTLERFTCVESISSSDHKPVLAEFKVHTSLPVEVDPLLPSAQRTLVEIADLAATDLLGMDMSGLSDPYVRLQLGNAS